MLLFQPFCPIPQVPPAGAVTRLSTHHSATTRNSALPRALIFHFLHIVIHEMLQAATISPSQAPQGRKMLAQGASPGYRARTTEPRNGAEESQPHLSPLTGLANASRGPRLAPWALFFRPFAASRYAWLRPSGVDIRC